MHGKQFLLPLQLECLICVLFYAIGFGEWVKYCCTKHMKDARVDYSISAYTFCIRRQWRLLLNLIPGIKRMDVVNKSDEGKNALSIAHSNNISPKYASPSPIYCLHMHSTCVYANKQRLSHMNERADVLPA